MHQLTVAGAQACKYNEVEDEHMVMLPQHPLLVLASWHVGAA